MNERLNLYVKPAVLDLDFQTDVSVSLQGNCKTTAASNAAAGVNNCGVGIPNRNCQTTTGS